MNGDNAAIELKQVCYHVNEGFWQRPNNIINDLTFSIPRHSVLGLLGRNGVGKTTTIKLASGLIRPSSGSAMINGRPAIHPQARGRIGLLTETQYVYSYLKLDEWLYMMGNLSGLKGTPLKKKILHLLDMFDLLSKSSQLMRSLSKGQLQRAGVAQTFLSDPEILLLDEPMSGLDPLWRSKIQNILLDYKKGGGTILFSSHIISDVLSLADHIAVMDSGHIKWSGSMSDLASKNDMYEVIFFVKNPVQIKQLLGIQKDLIRQGDNAWKVTINLTQKNNLLKLSASGKVDLKSLVPLNTNIESLLS